MPQPADTELNHEAIPAQQPLAASPGPELGQRRPKAGAGWGWSLGLILLLVASIGLALLGQR
jgi:hypothetical protein